MNIINRSSIAILLATYNGELYIAEQLDSLLSQTFKDWCCYIHDDGSTDSTMDICKRYSDEYPEKFVIIDSDPAGGAKNNFFYLLKYIGSDYYMFCDQDDVWLEEKISLTFNEMKESIGSASLAKLVFTDLTVVNQSLETIAYSMDIYQKLECNKHNFNKLLMQNVVTGCTVMINRKLRDMMLQPCNLSNIIMHDWWAALIATRFGDVSYINQPTILYRQHGNNSVGAKNMLSLVVLIRRFLNKNEISNSLNRKRLQAMEFAKTFKEEKSALVSRYAYIEKKNKLERICFYFRNGIICSGIIKNIGLIIFG